MNNKIREQLAEILTDLKVDRIGYVDAIEKIDKLYKKEMGNIFPTRDIIFRKIKLSKANEMPPTILDDDIAGWEHDNLESK